MVKGEREMIVFQQKSKGSLESRHLKGEKVRDSRTEGLCIIMNILLELDLLCQHSYKVNPLLFPLTKGDKTGYRTLFPLTKGDNYGYCKRSLENEAKLDLRQNENRYKRSN